MFGNGDTGNRPNAHAAQQHDRQVSSMVATGLRMKGAERFMLSLRQTCGCAGDAVEPAARWRRCIGRRPDGFFLAEARPVGPSDRSQR
jgi:hypothetical protein